MVDMTLYVDQQEHFITDLKVNDKEEIKVTFADGKVRTEPYSEHNYGYYRSRMVGQINEYADGAINDLGISYIKTMALRIGSLVVGIAGLFLLYNIDIHIVMKVMITILAVAGELAMYFFTNLYMMMLEDDSLEVFAYQEYVKHLDNFRFFDMDKGVDHYILPVEDIAQHHLDANFVKNINGMVEEMVSMGSKKKDIRIDYKKMEDNKFRK